MCGGGSPPKIPDPQPPKQPEKAPEEATTRRKTQDTGPRPPAGTLLTGGSGVPTSSLTTGGNVLLGN